MKKIILLLLICCSKFALAQKPFEGEIDYRMFGLSDSQKDTIIGDSRKILFGKNAIKIEIFTGKGILSQENLILFDSLKVIVIDHRSKSYWESWKAPDLSKMPPRLLPWGMNKVEIIHSTKKIAGYTTYMKRLTNDKNPDNGYMELRTEKSLSYHLPSRIPPNLFLDGMLMFENDIMIGMRLRAGVAPHTEINYVATKIVSKENVPSEFTVPLGYTLKTLKKLNFQ